MRFYIGNTDKDWFDFLSGYGPESVNFWKPSGASFDALKPGELFLFRLKRPFNVVAGGGFFVSFSRLPLSKAWDIFGVENGTSNFKEFQTKLLAYVSKQGNQQRNPEIGCVVLTQPFFLPSNLWIPQPRDWQPGIVQGKGYSTESDIGREIWSQVERNLRIDLEPIQHDINSIVTLSPAQSQRYQERSVKQRLGQGAFRTLVIDAYDRRCAMTQEKTLPVLTAAHIKPYAESGPHDVRNGILLRADLHTLFDQGYITITSSYAIEVSKRIREEYQNGKEYYALHGKVVHLPEDKRAYPEKTYLEWHNNEVYRG